MPGRARGPAGSRRPRGGGATAVRTVHHQHGEGFGLGSEKAGKVQVKAGAPMYDKDGNQVEDRRELRSTYEVYHVSDLNITNHRPRTAPNGSERAINAQDEAFKAICKENGEPERAPTDEERVSLVVSKELDNLMTELQSVKGVQVVEGADLDEARFRVKNGEPLIAIRRRTSSRPPTTRRPRSCTRARTPSSTARRSSASTAAPRPGVPMSTRRRGSRPTRSAATAG